MTIFIPIFSGNEGRHILRSDIFTVLTGRSDLQIIFFVRSEERRQYYEREFSHPRVRFEVVPRYRLSRTDAFFSFLKYYLLRTHTIDLKRRARYEREGNAARFAISFIANRIFGHLWIRRIIRFFDARVVRAPAVTDFFDQYHPDLVFCADLFDDTEAAYVREAQRRGIRVAGMILTWDRATSRWCMRVLPDDLIVHNQFAREEAARYQDMPAERVYIVGTIQHDELIGAPPAPLEASAKGAAVPTPRRDLPLTGPATREAFCASIGIPPEHKIIVYGPIGRSFDSSKELDQTVIDLLDQWIDQGALGSRDITIIVRFPPNDFLQEGDMKPRRHIRYQVPGHRFSGTRGQDWDMGFEDLALLRDTLFHASLIVTYYSSLSIDGAVLDKPIININFNVEHGRIVERRHPYYATTHYQKAAATGGIRLVQSAKELQEGTMRYLADPSRDREARARLVATQCGKVDGQSGSRAGEFLLSLLETNR